MTRKAKALEELRKAYESTKIDKSAIDYMVYNWSRRTIAEINEEIARAIAVRKAEIALEDKERFFATSIGAKLKKEAEDKVESIKSEIESIYASRLSEINKKIESELPGIAPYKATYYSNSFDEGYLRLSNDASRRLELEIRDVKKYDKSFENYASYTKVVQMGIASVGAFDISEDSIERAYYIAAGYAYSNSEAVKKVMEFAGAYEKEKILSLQKQLREAASWIKNPLHSEFIK